MSVTAKIVVECEIGDGTERDACEKMAVFTLALSDPKQCVRVGDRMVFTMNLDKEFFSELIDVQLADQFYPGPERCSVCNRILPTILQTNDATHEVPK